MATISFYAGPNNAIEHLSGSGLGFYGANFGDSVEVGAWQESTYITDSTGAEQGTGCENTQWAHPNSGIQSDIGLRALNYIPNRYATLNVRFTNDTAVRTQNARLRIFDRSNINNAASGVTTKVAELIHPHPSQTEESPSSDTSWSIPAGSSDPMVLENISPGPSGYSVNGSATSDTQHDWYFVISASPDSIGAKTLYGLYIELEYL
jgi:hypothetical protein